MRKIYRVAIVQTSEPSIVEMVRANNRQQAINHVARRYVTAAVATQDECLMHAGKPIADATVQTDEGGSDE